MYTVSLSSFSHPVHTRVLQWFAPSPTHLVDFNFLGFSFWVVRRRGLPGLLFLFLRLLLCCLFFPSRQGSVFLSDSRVQLWSPGWMPETGLALLFPFFFCRPYLWIPLNGFLEGSFDCIAPPQRRLGCHRFPYLFAVTCTLPLLIPSPKRTLFRFVSDIRPFL